MSKNRARSLMLVCLLTMTVALMMAGLTGCKESKADPTNGQNSVMNLMDQSGYFKGAPKELYFGKASQESFSDQGVTVKYLAAFNDGEATYLFFNIIDTGADLFSKRNGGYDFSLEEYDFSQKIGYTDSKMYDVVSYDEKMRTTTLCVEYIGSLPKENITFHVYSMNGNQKMINYTLEELDLYEMLKKTNGDFELEDQFLGGSTSFSIFDEKTGQSRNVDMPEFDEGNGDTTYRLKKDVIALPIEDEEGNRVADITNIGWKNGWLHVQINPENNIEWDMAQFNLQHNKTEKRLYSPFNMSFGGRSDQDVQDDYYEYVFYVGDKTKENLDYSISFRNTTYKDTVRKGDWQIKFAIPNSLVKKLEANKSISVNGHKILIDRAVVSPVKITLFAARDHVPEELEELGPDDLDLKIVYQDGKTIDIPKQSGYTHGNQKGYMFRITYTAENFEDIIGLEVKGVFFPVEN